MTANAGALDLLGALVLEDAGLRRARTRNASVAPAAAHAIQARRRPGEYPARPVAPGGRL